MTRANDELQTGVVSEQTDPSAANTFITNQLTDNNDGQYSPQDPGPAESGKEEKVVTFVKKVPVPYPVTKHGVYWICLLFQ